MVLAESIMGELEPKVRSIIKKQLGFSEPTLLAAAINSINAGASKDVLSNRLSGLLDHRKAAILADLITDAVDEFCASKSIPQIMANRKRPAEDNQDDDSSDAKKPSMMTPEEIRAIMASTLKALEEKKKNLGMTQEPSRVPLPPPSVVTIDSLDKSQTIAALHAQIANRLNKLSTQLPPVVPVLDRPTALILDNKGRTVDEKGQEIQLGHYEPTLKANLRNQKRDDHRVSQKVNDKVEQEQEAQFVDNRLAPKQALRTKKMSFRFVEPGKYLKEGQRLRMKAQLEKLQTEISFSARKTGIMSAAQLAKVAPKSHAKEVPKVEWWDSVLLLSGQESNYEPSDFRGDVISNLIEHPIQVKTIEANSNVQVPVFLTKKEMKKLRRQSRREAWKEKQDKIRLGIIAPDQPKVKMSNLMRVLGNEAVQDPTKVEAHVREQMAKRLANHAKANADRKLTSDQRKEKTIKKLKEDTSGGVHVSVFRVRNLANPSKKFKVETNAKQLFMTGCVVLFDDINVVVVEGGPKQQKKYRQLMINRIKWDEETYTDKDGNKVENRCDIVWEGQTKDRMFGELKFKQFSSEALARDHFTKAGVEHYWDLAFSGAVLESLDQM